MLEQAFRNYIPINSFSNERVERIEILVPQVGLRWGKPTNLRYDINEGESPKQSAAEGTEPDQFVIHHGVEIYRNFEIAEITSTKGDTINVEDIKEITFKTGEDERFILEPKRTHDGSILPNQFKEVKIITEYHVKFSFPSKSSAGTRGTGPIIPIPPEGSESFD